MLKSSATARTIIIGAGIGGLAAAVRLADAGQDVLVIERADRTGGKIRTVPSAAGPIDSGPTVFTMRDRFEALFQSVGERLEDHLDLVSEPLIARHYWPDGACLDLFRDHGASMDAVRSFAGGTAAREFDRFCLWARGLYEAFEGPVMATAHPRVSNSARAMMTRPGLWRRLQARSLHRSLTRQFSDPRLIQLFARYATYVGGSPFQSPAILALIWHAESRGVWRIRGGMVRLAEALTGLAQDRGALIHCGQTVTQIARSPNGGMVVHLDDGTHHVADQVLYNGDPAAISRGLLGPDIQAGVKPRGVEPRALSAYVWAFAGHAVGPELAHHTVFFNTHYRREFAAIEQGEPPEDATLYICAQDRGEGHIPAAMERFEIIMNAPAATGPAPDAAQQREIFAQCRLQTFTMLAERGLVLNPLPGPAALTTPHDFANAFPGSDGSLYGRSPQGMMATFRRPRVRTKIPGLYLAGGGVHPGAGVPMALTSGLHAAEAILKDRVSTSTSRQTATRGGMSMDSRIAAATASRSLPS